MHSANLVFAAAALAGLASAVPHARNHYYLHGRPIALGATVTGRSIYDGKCGPGDTCGPGYCCSQWGYCGTTQDYCGAGCQPQYGTCGAGNGTAPSSSDAPTAPAPAPSTAASSPSATDSANEAPAEASSKPAVPTLSFVSHAYVSPLATSAANNSPQTTLATQSSAPLTAPGPVAPSASAPAAPPTSNAPAPAPSSSSGGSSGGAIGSGVYKMFTGNGAASAGWPEMSAWASFDNLWNANLPTIKISCAQFQMPGDKIAPPENSDAENDEIKSAILSAAKQYGVDERFILAIMMQESKGCTRVYSTNNGNANPGLMQSHNGDGYCGETSIGAMNWQNPCPDSEITKMINDGVGGTLYKGTGADGGGDGLQQLLAGGTDAQAYYEAARKYNSGSIAASGDLGQGGATHCYCSDVANRLLGWTTSATNCHLGVA